MNDPADATEKIAENVPNSFSCNSCVLNKFASPRNFLDYAVNVHTRYMFLRNLKYTHGYKFWLKRQELATFFDLGALIVHTF